MLGGCVCAHTQGLTVGRQGGPRSSMTGEGKALEKAPANVRYGSIRSLDRLVVPRRAWWLVLPIRQRSFIGEHVTNAFYHYLIIRERKWGMVRDWKRLELNDYCSEDLMYKANRVETTWVIRIIFRHV